MQQKYDFNVCPAKQARNLEVFSVDKAVNQSGCEDDDSVSLKTAREHSTGLPGSQILGKSENPPYV